MPVLAFKLKAAGPIHAKNLFLDRRSNLLLITPFQQTKLL